MSIRLKGYTADGLYGNADGLKNASGVYVILGRNGDAETWKVVDVGESSDVNNRVATHDRSDCWKRRGYRTYGVAVIYCNAAQRMQIERELRNQFDPPCGDR